MPKRTQEEEEQPAKVYQLSALESQLNSVSKQMTEGFDRLNSSVNTLITKSENQVTPQQLESNIAALKIVFEDKLEEEIKKVHLEYGPMKDSNKWLTRAIAGAFIVALVNLFFLYTANKGGV